MTDRPFGPKVAHLMAPAPAGGAESVVLALATATRQHCRGIILNQGGDPDGEPLPLTTLLRAAGVPVDEIRCGRRRYLAESKQVAGLLAAHGVELVHTHGYHATVVGYLAARRVGVPVVSTVHGYLRRNLKERLYNVIDRRLLRRFDAVIAVSQEIVGQLVASGIDPQRVVMVQNGLDFPDQVPDAARARALLEAAPAEKLVGWIGRLSPEKGADLFIRALAEGNVPARAIVVGDGQELASVRQLVESLKLEGRVTLAGFRPNAAELLPGFDVLALTSRTEGTPMVILEAVAARVPIVSFRVGGVPDLLSEDSAWLVAPGDTSAFGAALRAALQDPAERRQRAENARNTLRTRLGMKQWLDRVSAVYRLAAAGDPRH